MTTVAFCDLKRRHATRRAGILEAAARVVDSGRFILGPNVTQFERAWSEYCGAQFAVGVASGTDAIALGLRAVGVVPGDRVLVPAATCIATWHAVAAIGAIPVPVDVDDDGMIDLTTVPDTPTLPMAIVPVHLYGRFCNLMDVNAYARNNGMTMITDAAQGHGLPCFGTTAYSFYPTKNLGALGDGGAVVTSSASVVEFVRDKRSLGGGPGGLNSRLDELQAAFLLAQIEHLRKDNTRRREIAQTYTAALADVGLRLPRLLPAKGPHVWHQYVIRHPERDAFRSRLLGRGIQTGCHYPTPPHVAYGHPRGSCPKAEALFAECVSLPIGPEITADDILAVCDAVRTCA